MTEITQTRTRSLLTDCPYCDGEGTDPGTALGLCIRCHGKGRMAHFLAERVMKRWARNGRLMGGDLHPRDAIPDSVPSCQ